MPDAAQETFRLQAELRRADRELRDLRALVQELREENHLLRARVDNLEAMRLALDVIGDDDFAALRQVISLWQHHHRPIKNAIKRVMFTSPNGSGIRHEVSGFQSGAFVYHCTSVGGVAMARAFCQAAKVLGESRASELLFKAMDERGLR